MVIDLREVLTALLLVSSATVAVGGATSLIARAVIRPLIRSEIDRHLAPNGHEGILPERERGQSIRTLVAWTRADIHEMKARLDNGRRWMAAHEDDHRDRDPSWRRAIE